MKKTLILLALLPSMCLAQWETRRVDNGLDDPYKIAFNENLSGNLLKLERVDADICFYLTSSYFCEDISYTEMAFKINGEWKKFVVKSYKSKDNTTLFLNWSLGSDEEMLSAFKSATALRIRTNDGVCGSDIYDFSMSNSTTAYNFMLK
jgi:hypothetical protein